MTLKTGITENMKIRGPLRRILDNDKMHDLNIGDINFNAADFFYSPDSVRALKDYVSAFDKYDLSGFPDSIEEINSRAVPDNYLPEDLQDQDLIARHNIRQIKYIRKARFLREIISHPECRRLDGFTKQVSITKNTVNALALLLKLGNLFRRKKLFTSKALTSATWLEKNCFGNIWPPGINLYCILREMYPAYHAFVTGQVSLWVAENMEGLLEKKVDAGSIIGLGRYTVDPDSRFLGLYPVAEVPRDELTMDSKFVAQDQMARKIIVSRVFDDIIEVFKREKQQVVVVIDYAGGVGNLSELLLKKIYAMPEGDMKSLMLNRTRVVVVDISDEQLAAGRNRFNSLSKNSLYRGMDRRIFFINFDVSKPLGEQQSRIFRKTFDKDFPKRPVYFGMTSYTTGALVSRCFRNGISPVEHMAEELYHLCWKIYAVDFTSPIWTMDNFIKDTGKWGIEYLRTIHGVVDEKDKTTPLNKIVSIGLRLLYRENFKNVADFVRFMSLGPGLATHYHTTWPHKYGHNSGYSVQEDGTLRKPNILSFASRLQSSGADVKYRTKVWLFLTMDLGRTSKDKRVLALVPGWTSGFVVAENKRNNPFEP